MGELEEMSTAASTFRTAAEVEHCLDEFLAAPSRRRCDGSGSERAMLTAVRRIRQAVGL